MFVKLQRVAQVAEPRRAGEGARERTDLPATCGKEGVELLRCALLLRHDLEHHWGGRERG